MDVEEHLLNKYKITAHRNIQWLADTISLRTFNGTNNDEEIYCRNTRQGKLIVTDDRDMNFFS